MILIKLNHQQQHYEAITIFREYHYLNQGHRKPNFYLSDIQKCIQEIIPFEDVNFEDFLTVLQKMNFRQSSEERFEVMLNHADYLPNVMRLTKLYI